MKQLQFNDRVKRVKVKFALQWLLLQGWFIWAHRNHIEIMGTCIRWLYHASTNWRITNCTSCDAVFPSVTQLQHSSIAACALFRVVYFFFSPETKSKAMLHSSWKFSRNWNWYARHASKAQEKTIRLKYRSQKYRLFFAHCAHFIHSFNHLPIPFALIEF